MTTAVVIAIITQTGAIISILLRGQKRSKDIGLSTADALHLLSRQMERSQRDIDHIKRRLDRAGVV